MLRPDSHWLYPADMYLSRLIPVIPYSMYFPFPYIKPKFTSQLPVNEIMESPVANINKYLPSPVRDAKAVDLDS